MLAMMKPHPKVDDYPDLAAYHAAVDDWHKMLMQEFDALPAIKRIERWHEYTSRINISTAFTLLGKALSDWAKEQQKGS